MDERVFRLYKFLLKLGRLEAAEIPEPYKAEIEAERQEAK
jgi:hypothetical protein